MNYPVLILILVLVGAIVWWFKVRKEKYSGPQTVFTETPKLHNVLQMPSEETYDALAYALGGLSN
ncbi:hypothetical protein BST79_gp273 [Only Syngen Nebraska virus 5]|uniref:hypothetical protein n=1 Tax=Only Syngen Nebraska virus 5 TaxID=1917232 RepID=UPI0009017B60|nr:hypothetical protein BST79_gp273 [Only Syngen Nebraska virus 5]APC25786.1 hypothetical protein [Only Syngen Nebraska virus 5]